MKLFNTLSGKKEEFKPLHAPGVKMYVCGPTVYDLGHLGHGRSAVSFDVVRKYLIWKGFEVKFVTNYTDIDDKLIERATQRGITVAELAVAMIPEYARDYAALGVMPGDVQPKATEYVAQMIELIALLEKKAFTYVLDDGVYFDVSKFPQYGKLSGQKLAELQSGARVAVKETKRSPQDFVLWKFSKPGEPKWESPWGAGLLAASDGKVGGGDGKGGGGDGRPGWHIECSAMSRALSGETLDIHGGGMDLIFPHHECEIAQSEAAYGKPLSRYWLHNGFITINKEKMSKSLGNFFTLRDIFAKFPAQAVRLLFLQTHYRSPIEFSDDLLLKAKNSLMRLHDFVRRLGGTESGLKVSIKSSKLEKLFKETRRQFEKGMDDDFDTSIALAAVFELVKELNRLMDRGELDAAGRGQAINLLQDLDKVLGVIFPIGQVSISDENLALIHEREEARKQKNWAQSDRIRNELLKKGIQLEDTPQGTIWKMI